MRTAQMCILFGLAQACGNEDPVAPDRIASVCHKASSLACEDDKEEADCIGDMRQARTEALQVGCADEFDGYLACLDAGSFSCSVENFPRLPEQCASARELYDKCLRVEHPICSTIPAAPSKDSPCETVCGDASARCSNDSPMVCDCSAGPRQGTNFTIQSCGELFDALDQYCR